MSEVAWLPMPEAELKWNTSRTACLYFNSPEDGSLVRVPVTVGLPYKSGHTYVWNIRVEKRIATVRPSIWFKGHFHSPYPVQFKIVKVRSTYRRRCVHCLSGLHW